MNNDLITIGMTCYNAENTIIRAIDSALVQTWPNFEIIIVDDYSTDGSAGIIARYIADHHQVMLVKHTDNQGPAGARQTILQQAKGAFIAFFDDDDESLPQRLRTQYERIVDYEQQSGESLIACYASGKRIYPNGYIMPLSAIGSKPQIPYGNLVANRALFYGAAPRFYFGSGTPSCSLMARKSTLETAGGFDSAFRRVEDIDFAIRLALQGGHFIGCPEELFIQHATTANDKAPAKNLEAEIQLAEKHKAYLQSVGRYDYAKTWPLIRYHHFQGEYLKMLGVLLRLFLRHPLMVAGHFSQTAPRRLVHEFRINRRDAS